MLDADQYGRAAAPHHDGSLHGIVMQDEGSTCLVLYRSTDGVRRVVTLTGVHKLDVSSFRQGNIIDSIMVFPSGETTNRGYDALLLRLGWGRLPGLKGRFLFVMDSSYGAEVIADCENVEIDNWEERPLHC
jgi:hypothetical protein